MSLSICVAMCTYNGAPYLREQLESIAKQDRLPDRMVVVDDGSSDATAQIARSFAREALFPVDVEINQQNLGYAKNFEKAIGLSEGHVIALADQDDVWDFSKLATIEKAFQMSPDAGLVFSDAQVVDTALRPLAYSLWEGVGFSEDKQSQVRQGHAFEVLLKRNVVTGATLAFKASYKPLVLPIPEGGIHDAWIALLVSAVAQQTVMIPDPLIKYRQHLGNQIGVRKYDLLNRLVAVRRMGRTQARELAVLQAALERLVEHGGVPAERLELLRATIDHLRVRASLPAQRIFRLAPISREVFRGRYRLLANGLPSAIKDFIA